MTYPRMAKFLALTAGILAVPALSFAGTEITSGTEAKTPVEKIKESYITGDLGVTVVSQYISRGVVLENQGAIVQPFADVYFQLYQGEGFLSKVTLNLGVWSSFHDQKTDAGAFNGTPGSSSTRNWYEFDFTAGVSMTFAKYFTFTPSYYAFLSPNDGFATFQGLNLKLAIDDSEWLGKFALKPTFQVLFELENKAGTGKDEGIYYEVAIAPGFPLGPVAVSFPIAAGFGSNDFYGSLDRTSGTIEDENFGFVSGGVFLTYPLGFIHEGYGVWTVTAGATFFHLGAGTEDFNTPSRGGSVRGEDADEDFVIFQGGLTIAF